MKDFQFYPRQREAGFQSNKEADMEIDVETKEIVEETTDEQPQKIVLSNKKKRNGRTK